NIKDIVVNENYLEEYLNKYINYTVYPLVVIKSGMNETIIREMDINVEYIISIIDAYIIGDKRIKNMIIIKFFVIFFIFSLQMSIPNK
ncbi:unnamed protein product, partial [marine sediment metagenome]